MKRLEELKNYSRVSHYVHNDEMSNKLLPLPPFRHPLPRRGYKRDLTLEKNRIDFSSQNVNSKQMLAKVSHLKGVGRGGISVERSRGQSPSELEALRALANILAESHVSGTPEMEEIQRLEFPSLKTCPSP